MTFIVVKSNGSVSCYEKMTAENREELEARLMLDLLPFTYIQVTDIYPDLKVVE